MNLKGYKIIFIFCAIRNVYPQELSSFLQSITSTHQALQNHKYSVEYQKYKHKVEKGKLYPKLDLQASAVKGRSSLNLNGEYRDVTLSLKQAIYSPTLYRQMLLEKGKETLSKKLTTLITDEIQYETLRLLLDYYKKEEHLNVLKQGLNTSKKNVQAIERRVRVGELTEYELDLAKAQYESQITLHETRQRDLLASKNNFENYTGTILPGQKVKTEVKKILNNRTPQKSDLTMNSEIIKLKYDLKIKIQNYNISKAKHNPTLDFIGRHSYNDRFRNQLGTEEETVYGLSLKIPIFSGKTIDSEVKSNKYLIQQQKYKIKEKKKEIRNIFNQSIRYLKSIRDSKLYTKQTIQSHKKALEGIKQKMNTGDSDLIKIFNQETKIIEFKHKMIDLDYEEKTIALDMFYLQGTLKEEIHEKK